MNDDQSSTNTSTQGMKTIEEWRQKYLKGPCNYAVTELIHDVQNDAISNTRRESAAEIERLKAELALANSDVDHWAKHARDIQAELAALRSQQQPATPTEPAESPLDKAAREAFGRATNTSLTPQQWQKPQWDGSRSHWGKIVAPFVKDEPPKPRKSDGELLKDAVRDAFGKVLWTDEASEHVAALFLAKRAERDGTTTERR